MSDNKPPMTVWLGSDAVACFDRNEDCGASDLKNDHHHVGPYVHLEQFMEAVDAVADGKHAVIMRQYSSDWMEAAQELAKEIMEGKG